MFISTWVLLVAGLVFAFPMIYLRVKDHTELEDETLYDYFICYIVSHCCLSYLPFLECGWTMLATWLTLTRFHMTECWKNKTIDSGLELNFPCICS